MFLRLEQASADGPGPESGFAQSAPSDQQRYADTHAPSVRAGAAPSALAGLSPTTHSEFEKIAGDFDHPSTSIVFGEKGSGKTAIRMQLADRVVTHNRAHPASRCFLLAYDELNPVLGRFIERVGTDKKQTLTQRLEKIRLIDHIDGMLSSVVPGIVDTILNERPDERPSEPSIALAPSGEDPRKLLRKSDKSVRSDLLVLQAIYDRPEGGGLVGGRGGAERRTRKLRRTLRLRSSIADPIWAILAYLGWAPALAVAYFAWERKELTLDPTQLTRLSSVVWVIAGLLAAYLLVVFKRSVYDRLRWLTLGHRVRKQVRVSVRSDASFARSMRQLDRSLVDPANLPMNSQDDVRYAMMERLGRVLRAFGHTSILVIIDRVDEPTLISGDPDRMRAVIWPLMNNKFLQQPGIGVKMLLPMELRHALFRESAAFFQEARLDKQNLIERLAWTGAMLYDLCNARLQACRSSAPGGGASSIALLDLFAEDVTRQDLIDALDQMHQPRDAFKMLYQCFTDHCASQTSDQPAFRVPRLILDMVRKSQVERVRQLYRGVRPA